MNCSNFSKCNCCNKLVKTINVSLFGNVLLLTIPSKNYFNNEEICVLVAQSLPENCDGSNIVVHIQLGNAGPQYPLTVCGKNVYADQIRCRRIYCMRVATDTKVFAYNGQCKLPCTEHVFPPILPLTVSEVSNESNMEIESVKENIEIKNKTIPMASNVDSKTK